MQTLTKPSPRDTTTSTSPASTHQRSVLGHLRQLIPQRPGITYDEALRIAELQAARLHDLLGASSIGITESDLARLPHLRIVVERIATSGSSHWNGREWIICLNASDALTRQRFTLLHEFKHIVDHGATHRLYGSRGGADPERAADYFAGCVLVPRRDLKATWGNGLQAPDLLAEHFGVSLHAITVRLAQTGLSRVDDHDLAPRCARPIPTPRFQPQQFTYVRSRP